MKLHKKRVINKSMKIIKCASYDEASAEAYKLMLERMSTKADIILGLPTGSTPLGLYNCMANGYRRGDFDYKAVITFNIDEYAGMNRSDPDSYFHFMQKNLFEHINIPAQNVNIPSGIGDLEANCLDYDRRIAEAGGIDLQILGVGGNGHIGFNEPGTPFESTTHIISLKDETRAANARFFSSLDLVPRQAVTMGIKMMMNAREIIFIASGEEKAEAMYKTVHGEITPDCPSSVLQLHPNITIFVDQAAAARL